MSVWVQPFFLTFYKLENLSSHQIKQVKKKKKNTDLIRIVDQKINFEYTTLHEIKKKNFNTKV